jgi:hypothetical protein
MRARFSDSHSKCTVGSRCQRPQKERSRKSVLRESGNDRYKVKKPVFVLVSGTLSTYRLIVVDDRTIGRPGK